MSSKSTNPTTVSASAATLLDTLIPVGAIALVYFGIFLVIRTKFPRMYMPRTFMTSLRPQEQSHKLSDSRFGWFKQYWNTPDHYVLTHHSLDSFLLLRLLKQSVIACVVGCVITWPVLFPVNATGGGGQKQLDVINMSNIKNNYYRYFAHAGCAYLFFGYLLWMITRESIYYINLRQAYLLSPGYSSRLSARTVLFTSVPEPYMDEATLRRTLGESVVKRVWLATDCSELDDLVKKRDKLALKLEGAETSLIRNANKNRLKAEKEASKGKGKAVSSTENGNGEHATLDAAATAEAEKNNSSVNTEAARWLDPKKRPTHRLKMLIGKKVDTIDYCRAELPPLAADIETKQAEHRNASAKKLNSVFVEFYTLADAQAAYQSLTHHQVLHMAPRFTGFTPGDVIWSNLRIKWWERIIRLIITTSFITVLVIFWAVPVAFVGSFSNLQSLAQTPGLGWLSFILKTPRVILGLITGLLPSILLAVLMALLPIILRLTAKHSGDPTRSAVELSTQNYYFAFQVVNVFLVTTLGSAASAAVGKIVKDPTGIPTLLATSIPRASNFYFSYFILQGLGIVSGLLLQLVGLIIFIALSKLLDNTPRKMYNRWNNLSGLGWGTLFPVYTNLFVVGICYAIIAPFVLFFAAAGLSLFYLAYRYNLLYVTNNTVDTQGRVYGQALQHIFVGIYIAQFCLIGLFAIGTASSVGALGPLILMIILLVFTILYHMSLASALRPLIDYLPKSLEAEERRLLAEEAANGEKPSNGTTEYDAPSEKKPTMFQKFFKPHVHDDYLSMRKMIPRAIEVHYDEADERDAYYNPSIASATPLLWIPRDQMGLSTREIKDTPKDIQITDEGASLDDKNKIVWNQHEVSTAPIYEAPVYY